MSISDNERKQSEKLSLLFKEFSEKGTYFEYNYYVPRGWCRVSIEPAMDSDLSRWRVADAVKVEEDVETVTHFQLNELQKELYNLKDEYASRVTGINAKIEYLRDVISKQELKKYIKQEPEIEPMDKLVNDILEWFDCTGSYHAKEEITAILKLHNVTENLWQTILLAPKEPKTPKDTDLLLWSKDWIHEDFCPSGIRDGFWHDEDGWVTAKWNACHDCWDNENNSEPTHFMLKSNLVNKP